MLTTDSRTNCLPTWLLVACGLLLIIRLLAIRAEISAPDMVTLIKWEKFSKPPAKDLNLLDKPYIYLFLDETDTIERLRWQLCLGTIFKNREVADLMMKNFRCVKVSVTPKKPNADIQAFCERYHVSSMPALMCTLPDGTQIDDDCMQFSDRLMVAKLETLLKSRYKIAGDRYMALGNYKDARAAYREYLQSRSGLNSSQEHATLRYYVACKKLGLTDEAAQALQTYSKEHDSILSNYLQGKISQDETWQYFKESEPTTAAYIIAMHNLFDGKKSEAERNLLWVAMRGDRLSPDYRIAVAELHTLGLKLPIQPEFADGDSSDDGYRPAYSPE